MRSTIPPEERLDIKKKTHKNLMYLGIASIIMIFLGFTSGYYISKMGSTWVSINVPDAFYISTGIIMLSSITLFIGTRLAKKENFKPLPILFGTTLILGLMFAFYQYKGWNQLVEKGMYLTDAVNIKGLLANEDVNYGEDYVIIHKGDELKYVDGEFYDLRDEYNSNPILPKLDSQNTSSSWFWLLTIVHLAHLIGGLLSLLVVTIKSLRKKYNENDIVGIQVSSIYWHFLDILWLYLLLLLIYVG